MAGGENYMSALLFWDMVFTLQTCPLRHTVGSDSFYRLVCWSGTVLNSHVGDISQLVLTLEIDLFFLSSQQRERVVSNQMTWGGVCTGNTQRSAIPGNLIQGGTPPYQTECNHSESWHRDRFFSWKSRAFLLFLAQPFGLLHKSPLSRLKSKSSWALNGV